MVAERFARRLRELREEGGFTQLDLAEKVGVTRDAIARWEAGRREPSWGNVLALAAALGVSVEAFAVAPAEDAAPRARGRPKKAAEQGEAPAPKGEASVKPASDKRKKGAPSGKRKDGGAK